MAAEEAGTDGTMNVQCRSNDDDYMKTTIMNLPTDFVKLTEPTLSRVVSTLLHLYNYCAARSALSWTFCNTVWNNITVEELTQRCSDLSVCQTMSGAALVDD